MLRFAWPYVFLLLPAPWLAWRYLKPVAAGGAIRVPFDVAGLAGSGSRRGARVSAAHGVLAVCWVLLVAAGARPQWLGESTSVPSSARDLMLAVDVSKSMSTADMVLDGARADRLAVVKRLAGEFLARRAGDRVGLVLFGTNAYLQAPLTADRETVATLLDEASIGIAGERTAIGDAVGLSLKRLRRDEVRRKVLVLMTDGANTAGNVEPAEAARLAAADGLVVHAIGIGAERMRVSTLLGTREINPSAELDEALLKSVAETTGGRYFRAASSASLEEIYRVLDEIEPTPRLESAREVKEYFFWPLSGVAALAAAWLAWMLARSAS